MEGEGEEVRWRSADAGALEQDQIRNGVVVIELNRAATRNALTPSLLRKLAALFVRAANDPEVRVVILTGAGKGFCSGADLKQDSGGDDAARGQRTSGRGQVTYDRVMSDFGEATLAIANCPKPVIAAINGAAAGAGASLALACDFRVMAEDAYLLQAFINIALVPDAGSAYFLVRQVGYSKALEISLEGKPLKAAECVRLGLANKMVPPADLMAAATEWARQLAQQSTFASGLTKSVLHFASTHSLSKTIEYEARMQQFCAESEDHAEGRAAFRQKRKARFNVGGAPVPIPRGVVARL